MQPYFRWAGIDGVTNPFVPEVVVNHDLLPMEWPFTRRARVGTPGRSRARSRGELCRLAHCQAGTDQTRYSAALWAFGHVFAASPREQQLVLSSRLGDGSASAILRAIAMRTSQRVRVVQQVSWATYDRYLKSNRVSEGLASYDAAIVLILAGIAGIATRRTLTVSVSRRRRASAFCNSAAARN